MHYFKFMQKIVFKISKNNLKRWLSFKTQFKIELWNYAYVKNSKSQPLRFSKASKSTCSLASSLLQWGWYLNDYSKFIGKSFPTTFDYRVYIINKLSSSFVSGFIVQDIAIFYKLAYIFPLWYAEFNGF